MQGIVQSAPFFDLLPGMALWTVLTSLAGPTSMVWRDVRSCVRAARLRKTYRSRVEYARFPSKLQVLAVHFEGADVAFPVTVLIYVFECNQRTRIIFGRVHRSEGNFAVILAITKARELVRSYRVFDQALLLHRLHDGIDFLVGKLLKPNISDKHLQDKIQTLTDFPKPIRPSRGTSPLRHKQHR